ncbi:hypothetical protein HMPREF1141_0660 [Clostridium sp. MSTE9]|nr:hypothetical protein HMPREF1141_0660 [Clostridium sp. MSTE9]
MAPYYYRKSGEFSFLFLYRALFGYLVSKLYHTVLFACNRFDHFFLI